MILDHWSGFFIRKYELFVAPIGLVFNIVLLGTIVKCTPAGLKTYSVIILLSSVSDLVMGISIIMQTARTFPIDTQLFFMFQGFCELYSNDLGIRAKFCMFCYAQKIMSYLLNHVLLIAACIYRVLLIIKPFDQFNRKRVYFTCYGYTVVHYAYFNWVDYMVLEPMDKVTSEVAKVRPELIGSNWTYYGVLDSFSPSQIVFTISAALAPWVVLCVTPICWWKIRKFLTKFQFSATSKELHKAISNVLLAQTLGPLLSAVTITLYLAVNGRHDSLVPLLENIMQLPLGTTIVFNPIVTVFFVTPYRKAVQKLLRIRATATAPLTAAASNTLN